MPSDAAVDACFEPLARLAEDDRDRVLRVTHDRSSHRDRSHTFLRYNDGSGGFWVLEEFPGYVAPERRVTPSTAIEAVQDGAVDYVTEGHYRAVQSPIDRLAREGGDV